MHKYTTENQTFAIRACNVTTSGPGWGATSLLLPLGARNGTIVMLLNLFVCHWKDWKLHHDDPITQNMSTFKFAKNSLELHLLANTTTYCSSEQSMVSILYSRPTCVALLQTTSSKGLQRNKRQVNIPCFWLRQFREHSYWLFSHSSPFWYWNHFCLDSAETQHWHN